LTGGSRARDELESEAKELYFGRIMATSGASAPSTPLVHPEFAFSIFND